MSSHAIIHSQVSDGNLSYFYGVSKKVQANRTKFLAKYGLSLNDCVAARLSHSCDITCISAQDKGKGMTDFDSGVGGDCMISTDGTPLFLLTADCLPVVISDNQNKSYALAHLSRHNTQLHFISKIINTLKTNRDQLQVYFGPCIKSSYNFNLVSHNCNELERVGVLSINIHINPTDTYTSPDYFSHRRSRDLGIPEGRFTTIVIPN